MAIAWKTTNRIGNNDKCVNIVEKFVALNIFALQKMVFTNGTKVHTPKHAHMCI